MARLEYRSISKRTVDGLSVGDKDTVFWDRELSGFGVRVYPSGAKVYVVQTRALGCQRRSKISPPGRSKTSPLNVMRCWGVVPVVHRRDPRCFV